MNPEFVHGNVLADCPDCGVATSFEYREPGGSEYGSVNLGVSKQLGPILYERLIHKLLKCSVRGRPGVASVAVKGSYTDGLLESFWPTSLVPASLPEGVPEGITTEFREAELCMSVQAWRGAAALLRSALEKTLGANGFSEADLYKKIEAACADGVITSARRQRAQDLVCTLGNDVLHDDWRPVTEGEARDAHHYVARVIEDFYDDRPTVEGVLTSKNRKFS